MPSRVAPDLSTRWSKFIVTARLPKPDRVSIAIRYDRRRSRPAQSTTSRATPTRPAPRQVLGARQPERVHGDIVRDACDLTHGFDSVRGTHDRRVAAKTTPVLSRESSGGASAIATRQCSRPDGLIRPSLLASPKSSIFLWRTVGVVFMRVNSKCAHQVSLALRPFSASIPSTRRVALAGQLFSPATSAVVRRSPIDITDALRGGRV
ncbi:MAG: hypothetical protein Udaeo2_21330 [Candidatus Udaeobacter sp.]|nr:MAG: hypothetical protein Udaeo2_21330 [Candidatus Udaeobacter sp.]